MVWEQGRTALDKVFRKGLISRDLNTVTELAMPVSGGRSYLARTHV